MIRRLAVLVAVALVAAVAGGFVAWQYLAWRVYVAEGIRDMYMAAAGEAQMKCAQPQPGRWPQRQGP